MRVAAVIPTFDEEDSIGPVIAGLPRDIIHRVIVVDGGSRDATEMRVRDAGAEFVCVGRGYGRACLRGAQIASDCDILLFMDGDGADDPASIGALVGPLLRDECDFVIASRVGGNREPGSMAMHQVLSGLAAGRLIGLLYGVRYTDMCAFRAIRRDVLLNLGMRELGYGWNLEMQMRVARAGLRVREVPVPYRRRFGGRSKVAGSVRGTLIAGSRIVSTFARVSLEPLRDRVPTEHR